MTAKNGAGEGRSSRFCSTVLFSLYGRLKGKGSRLALRSLVLRKEGGPVYSLTIRKIYRAFHGVDVGLYTIGPCDVAPGNLAPGTTVGRYSSIYYTVRTLADDESMSHGSDHKRFPSAAFGRLGDKAAAECRIGIGHDVFMGHNATILSSVEHIGHGAVIGAGAVVQNNVPPYAVVAGNPARVVRFRFSDSVIKDLLASQWWLKSIHDLSENLVEFQKPLEGDGPIR